MVLEACQGGAGKEAHKWGKGGRAGLAWAHLAFKVTWDRVYRLVSLRLRSLEESLRAGRLPLRNGCSSQWK